MIIVLCWIAVSLSTAALIEIAIAAKEIAND
jgi:hypothetical protein